MNGPPEQPKHGTTEQFVIGIVGQIFLKEMAVFG